MKIRYRREDEEELRTACHTVDEEIALIKRSASLFQCLLSHKSLKIRNPLEVMSRMSIRPSGLITWTRMEVLK